jgi:phosphoesterase RecJ-like protein
MKLSPETIAQCQSLIARSNHIIITNHVNPDGDAMGSAVGLQLILQSAGKASTIVVPNPYPDFLKWMEAGNAPVVYEEDISEASSLVKKADLIIHLDYNALKRSGPMEEALTAATATRIVIDHHQQPDDFAEVLISETEMSSTCEMVYHFAVALGMQKHITTQAAECLYTGIITDTGNFRFSGTTPVTHTVAGSLLQKGVEPHIIASRVYDNNSVNRLGLLGRTLEKMQVLPQWSAVIMNLSAADLAEFNYKKGDTEGFVNYGLSVAGIVLSIFLTEKDGLVKISFRSKGEFNVNLMARQLFDGGGHVNAAGAVSELGLKETIEKIKAELPKYKDELQNAG